MHLPDLNKDAMYWDQWRRFHWGSNGHNHQLSTRYEVQPIIVFDNGEVVYTDGSPRPDRRGRFDALGFSVLLSSTGRLPYLTTPDGVEVKNAWLNRGGGTLLLVDHGTHVVVGLVARYDRLAKFRESLWGIEKSSGVPYFSARFAKPGARPDGAPVTFIPPLGHKDYYTQEERAQIKRKMDMLKAYTMIHDDLGAPYRSIPVDLDRLLAMETPADFDKNERLSLYHHGPKPREITVPHLLAP